MAAGGMGSTPQQGGQAGGMFQQPPMMPQAQRPQLFQAPQMGQQFGQSPFMGGFNPYGGMGFNPYGGMGRGMGFNPYGGYGQSPFMGGMGTMQERATPQQGFMQGDPLQAWQQHLAQAQYAPGTDMNQAREQFMNNYALQGSPQGRMQVLRDMMQPGSGKMQALNLFMQQPQAPMSPSISLIPESPQQAGQGGMTQQMPNFMQGALANMLQQQQAGQGGATPAGGQSAMTSALSGLAGGIPMGAMMAKGGIASLIKK